MEKDFLDERGLVKPTTAWTFKDVNSERGTEEFIKKLGFPKEAFPNPKPIGTIQRILSIASNKTSTVLDFFAGSGTTGQTVIKLNAGDGGTRQFILCTNNENNICREVTYERIKRANDKEGCSTSLRGCSKSIRYGINIVGGDIYEDFYTQLSERHNTRTICTCKK